MPSTSDFDPQTRQVPKPKGTFESIGQATGQAAGGILGGVLGGFNPLSAIPGVSSGPALSGIHAAAPSNSGGNLINVGNPIQNLGEIVKYMNAGSSVMGGFPTIRESDYTRGLGAPNPVGFEVRAGQSKAAISLGGWIGIAALGVGGYMIWKNHVA